LKIFAQEGLGRPDLEIASEINAVQRYLADLLEEEDVPEVQAVLVFTNDNVEVLADDAPVPAVHVRKLKDFVRKTAKSKPISLDKAKEIQQALSPA
jgi:hypothetical protein